MNKKLIGGIILALIIAGVSFLGYQKIHSSSVAGAESNSGSIYLTPLTKWGDTYGIAFGTSPYSAPTKILIDISGNWVGNIIASGTTAFNNVIQGILGFNSSFTTSTPINTTTTITAAQFCGAASILVANTTNTITLTLPSATSSYLACGSPLPGAVSTQVIVNDSTNSIKIAGGTGVTLMNETVGPGTTTVSGVINTIPATSTQIVTGIWDASTTIYVLQGNTYH